MNKMIMRIENIFSFLICFMTIFASIPIILAADEYPMEVSIIDKNKSRYDTPENSYTSIISSMVSEDVDWYYEGLTQKSADHEIMLYKKYSVDIQKKFDTVKDIKNISILDKQPYKNGVYLLVRVEGQDGSVFQGPSIFFLEDGLWKSSQEIPIDDPVLELLQYIPPPDYITPFVLKVFPSTLDISWYNWIEKHIQKQQKFEKFITKISLLCVLYSTDDAVKIEDIITDTIRLNQVVSPTPWHFFSKIKPEWENEVVLFSQNVPQNQSSFSKKIRPWLNLQRQFAEPNKHLLFVRFSMFETMKTLPEITPDSQHQLILSGTLKGGKEFRATVQVSLVTHKYPVPNSKKPSGIPPSYQTYKKQWWNH